MRPADNECNATQCPGCGGAAVRCCTPASGRCSRGLSRTRSVSWATWPRYGSRVIACRSRPTYLHSRPQPSPSLGEGAARGGHILVAAHQGPLPTTLGDLSLLEHLDISDNNLTGALPSAQMSLQRKQSHLHLPTLLGLVVWVVWSEAKEVNPRESSRMPDRTLGALHLP